MPGNRSDRIKNNMKSGSAPAGLPEPCRRSITMKNLLRIAATTLVIASSSIAALADPIADRFGTWDATDLNCSSDTARPDLCASLFAIAAEYNTPKWLAVLNASPVETVESPVITVATTWIGGTSLPMGELMAFGK
jgi:hypothetical protein